MKLVGYIRVSSDKQSENGHSLEAQEAKIRQYCALYGHEVAWVYRDEAVSASTLDRNGLDRALSAMCDSGRIDGLIVSKLDRLTRSVKDFAELIEGPFRDKALVSVSDSIDTSTAAGRLVLNVLVSVSQWEREAIGERTREVMQHMKEEGRRVGGVPYGWMDEGGRLVENAEEQWVIDYVKRGRELGWKWSRIARELNNLGWFSRSGNAFQVTQLKRMVG